MRLSIRLLILIVCLSLNAISTPARTNKKQKTFKTFSVLGDSYSTFREHTHPASNAQWYPNAQNDVKEVGQTWWSMFEKQSGIAIERNNSFSGSTVCHTGYRGNYVKESAFVTRCNNLGNPDLIIIEGATNDSWAGAPIGQYKYDYWTEDDLLSFRPAMAKMLYYVQQVYPKATVVFMLNSELKEEINTSVEVICKHYNVPLLKLHDIGKQSGHPDQAGMKSICEQLTEFLKKL